jgi:hypothetical protein
MPINFQIMSMMDLRSAPGEVLDRVAEGGEAFIVERKGQQKACLVPISVFMPDIQPARLAREFNQLQSNNEWHRTSITDDQELELHFREEGAQQDKTIRIRLPHGYPNTGPKVFIDSLPQGCPHRWSDGSLCVFGPTALWNPGQHDAVYVLGLARRWLARFAVWERKGVWGDD